MGLPVRKSESLLRWEGKRDEWRRRYGAPSTGTFDPTNISVIRICGKCTASRVKMSRHHKGHEFLFACLMEEKYAPRYILFHSDDVVWLCNKCHIRAHVVIEKLVKEVWKYYNTQMCLEEPLEFDTLEKIRKRIVRATNRWLAYKKKKRRKRTKKETTTRKQLRKLKEKD